MWNPVTRWLACKANSVTTHVPPPPRCESEPRRRILLVHAHPREDSFSRALAGAVESGAAAGGHELRSWSLYADGFQPALTASERGAYFDGLASANASPEVRAALGDLRWCDSVVFVYPTWWFNLPAMLKGWLDRTLLPGPGGAWDFPPPGGTSLVPQLDNVKRMAGVSTYGATKPIAFLAGDNGRNCLATAIRHGVFGTQGFLGLSDCTCSWHALYSMDFCTKEER